MRVALIVCVCAACGGHSSDPAPAPGGGAEARDAAIVNAPATGPSMHVIRPDVRSLPEPSITLPMTEAARLVDAGATPRARLRYAWNATASRELTVEASLTSRRLAPSGAWSDPIVVPPVREGFGVLATPGAGGGASIAFRGLTASVVGTPDGDAKLRADEYLQEFRDRIEHRRGTIAADDRGRLGVIAFADATPAPAAPAPPAAPDRALDDVTQRWLAAAVPLPDEPIGAGAHWRVVTVLRAGAAVVKQTADYTLVEIRADRWIIDEDVKRIGEDQLVESAGLPTGSIAELIGMFRENQGRVELSPSMPWPIAGKLSTELRIQMRLGIPGEGEHEDITEDTGTLTFSAK